LEGIESENQLAPVALIGRGKVSQAAPLLRLCGQVSFLMCGAGWQRVHGRQRSSVRLGDCAVEGCGSDVSPYLWVGSGNSNCATLAPGRGQRLV